MKANQARFGRVARSGPSMTNAETSSVLAAAGWLKDFEEPIECVLNGIRLESGPRGRSPPSLTDEGQSASCLLLRRTPGGCLLGIMIIEVDRISEQIFVEA